MRDERIYAVHATYFKPGAVHPELGGKVTEIVGYATGNEQDIREQYSGRGYMELNLKPIEVQELGNRDMGRAWSSYLEEVAA